MELKNKHVLITGAGQRIGRCLAEHLLESSSEVRLTAHYRRSEKAVAELVALHPKRKILPAKANLSEVKSLRAMVGEAQNKFGPVDILVNCASIFTRTPARECTEEAWDEMQAVNIKGQFFLAQACAVEMEKKGGLILNIVDCCVGRTMRNFTPYMAAKAGLLMMTRNLAKEWAPKIRVNAISPGPIIPPEHYTKDQLERSSEKTLLKRWGEPKDIAEAALFLIQNDYITGLDLIVDGGRSLSD